jgi:hypothetical protein
MARRRALLRNPVRTRAEVARLVRNTAGDSDEPDYYVPTMRFTVQKESVEKMSARQKTQRRSRWDGWWQLSTKREIRTT